MAKFNENKYWFKAYKFRFGWYPVTWQGWLVVILFYYLIVSSISRSPLPLFYAILLIVICYLKGEKIEWKWVNKKINK